MDFFIFEPLIGGLQESGDPDHKKKMDIRVLEFDPRPEALDMRPE